MFARRSSSYAHVVAARDVVEAEFARCRGVLSIDLVIFAGFDQEVYRKTPFHLLLLCPKAPVRQAVLAYLVATYGLSAESTAMLERKAKRMGCKGTTALSKADVFSALNFCSYDGVLRGPFGFRFSADELKHSSVRSTDHK